MIQNATNRQLLCSKILNIKTIIVQGWHIMRKFLKENQQSKEIYHMSGIRQELLQHEIHHCIKNNLNTIASILGLQINNLDQTLKKDPKEILENSKKRIETIAMNYDSLYQNHNTNQVSFKEYVQNLTDLINNAHNRNITVQIESDHIFLSLERMFRLGIILSELFTNSIKYAFKHDNNHDQIKISLLKYDNHFLLVYHESRNDNINIEKIMSSQTLGMRLIKLTVKQIGGTLEVTRNKGLIFTIDFLSEC